MTNFKELLEKLPVVQLLKNLPTFYGTWRFITVFKTALINFILFWGMNIQNNDITPASS
jgi:hypothetical protein